MQNLKEHLDANPGLRDRCWLLIGKGPGFASLADYDTSAFIKLGINHTIRHCHAEYCHIMDIEVVQELGTILPEHADFLVMPEYPHTSYQLPGLKGTFHRAGDKSLEQWARETPILAELAQQGRLLFYRASSHDYRGEAFEPIKTGSFSASTVVTLLGEHGIRSLRTLGIDGGTSYSEQFESLGTRLEAGQDSFDIQFAEMAAARYRHDMDLLPLDDEEEIAVYVGSEEEQELAYQVLKFSIESRSSRSVRVYHLGRCLQHEFPEYYEMTAGLPTGTPFSLQRFAIPRLQNFKGRAIYVDSDMQVFTDITRLWTIPLKQQGFLSATPRPGCERPAQLSVMLIDCAKSGWDIADLVKYLAPGGDRYERLYLEGEQLGSFERRLPWQWNSLEHHQADVELLHYTNMATQPWLSWHNPLAELWCRELMQLLEKQPEILQLLKDHVERGWIRPSLQDQVDSGLTDPLLLSPRARRKDEQAFVPPHAYFKGKTARSLTGYGLNQPGRMQLLGYRIFAYSRYCAMKLGIFSLLRKLRSLFNKIRRALGTGLKLGT